MLILVYAILAVIEHRLYGPWLPRRWERGTRRGRNWSGRWSTSRASCRGNIGILIDIVDTGSNSNVQVVRTLYSTTDLDFGSHRAHRVGGAKHSLIIMVRGFFVDYIKVILTLPLPPPVSRRARIELLAYAL